jgi:hypothetical protein
LFNGTDSNKLFLSAGSQSFSFLSQIMANVGFPKMVIQNNINGIIVEKNTIENFTKAIETLYNDKNLLKSFSNRIKTDYLEQLDNQKLANDLKKFIEHNDHRKRTYRQFIQER